MVAPYQLNPDDHPTPDAVEAYDDTDDVIHALKHVLGPPLTTEFAREPDGRGLSKTWLRHSYRRALHLKGELEQTPDSDWSRGRLLVTALNTCEVEGVGSVLGTDDARLEAETIYRGLYETAASQE